jgi:hypothetical protein
MLAEDIWCPENPIRLDQLAKKIEELQKAFGVRAIIKLDAGYNNICLNITPSKKAKTGE